MSAVVRWLRKPRRTGSVADIIVFELLLAVGLVVLNAVQGTPIDRSVIASLAIGGAVGMYIGTRIRWRRRKRRAQRRDA